MTAVAASTALGSTALEATAATEPAAVARPTELSDVARLARPLVLARDQTVALLPGLADLVPEGGLQRGSTVVVEGGPGATSLALALAAGPSAAGGWVAVVGRPDLGLAAAVEAGIVAERLVLVAEPPRDQWATVVAALVGAVDVVLAGPQRVGAADARRLAARARERGTVLVQVAPGPGRSASGRSASGRGAGLEVDLRWTVTEVEWQGLGQGHGHLRSRRIAVEATGRRRAARPRRAELWLPDEQGRIRAVARESLRSISARTDHGGAVRRSGPAAVTYAGADIDRLVVVDDEVAELPGAG
jgi:hypothetical protein